MTTTIKITYGGETVTLNDVDRDEPAATAATAAASLISRSISHTEIATAEWSADLAADLAAECDDSTEASDTVVEYWGTDEDGAEWRVHLTGDRSDAAP